MKAVLKMPLTFGDHKSPVEAMDLSNKTVRRQSPMQLLDLPLDVLKTILKEVRPRPINTMPM